MYAIRSYYGVAQATAATLHDDVFFSVVRNFEKNFAGFIIFGDSAKWNFNCDILAIGTGTALFAARFTMAGKNMTLIT